MGHPLTIMRVTTLTMRICSTECLQELVYLTSENRDSISKSILIVVIFIFSFAPSSIETVLSIFALPARSISPSKTQRHFPTTFLDVISNNLFQHSSILVSRGFALATSSFFKVVGSLAAGLPLMRKFQDLLPTTINGCT